MNRHVQRQLSVLEMTPVGFEPTQLALVELESTPLDHSGKVSIQRRRKVGDRRAQLALGKPESTPRKKTGKPRHREGLWETFAARGLREV
jgi:hypothetical protein